MAADVKFMQVYLHYNDLSPFRSLNDNHLTGEIPDAFQSLTQLINLYGLILNNNLKLYILDVDSLLHCVLNLFDGAINRCAEIYLVII